MWVHCPRASNGLLPRRSDLVGYVQWDARFDQVLLVKQSFPTALQVAILQADFVGTNVETNRLFLVFRVLLMIQFDLPGLRGSCAASMYSVEDGPNPVI